jgi:hypothetical protein
MPYNIMLHTATLYLFLTWSHSTIIEHNMNRTIPKSSAASGKVSGTEEVGVNIKYTGRDFSLWIDDRTIISEDLQEIGMWFVVGVKYLGIEEVHTQHRDTRSTTESIFSE